MLRECSGWANSLIGSHEMIGNISLGMDARLGLILRKDGDKQGQKDAEQVASHRLYVCIACIALHWRGIHMGWKRIVTHRGMKEIWMVITSVITSCWDAIGGKIPRLLSISGASIVEAAIVVRQFFNMTMIPVRDLRGHSPHGWVTSHVWIEAFRLVCQLSKIYNDGLR